MSTTTLPAAARPVRGMLLMVLAFGLITINDAAMKWALAGTPVAQAIFIRGIFSLLVLLSLSLYLGRLRELRWRKPWAQIFCGLAFTVSLFCFVTSLNYLPLALAVVIISASPMFVTVFAPIFLGERVGWWRRSAVLLGFVGTIIVMQPGTESFDWPLLLPLIAACLNAGREIVVRHVIGTESSISMVLTAMLFVSGFAAAASPFVWVAPSAAHIGFLALSGACLAFGLILAFEAIRSADVSIVSPFQYSSIIWATLIGFAVWSDVPSWSTILGATLIFCGGLVILRRERVPKHHAVVSSKLGGPHS